MSSTALAEPAASVRAVACGVTALTLATLVGVPASAGTIDYTDGANLTVPITLSNPATLNVNSGAATQSGALGEGVAGMAVTKTGPGQLTLSGTNTYTGLTTIAGGTLTMGIANAIATSSGVLVQSGTTFDLGGFNQSIGTLTINSGGTVQIGAKALTISDNANTVWSGTIHGTADTGQIKKTGTGTVTFDNFTQDGGELHINGGAAALTSGTSSIWYLAVGSDSGTAGMTMSGGTLNISGGPGGSLDPAFQIGDWGGTGTMNQTGGAVTVTSGSMNIGNQGGTGTYNISGGTLSLLGGLHNIGRNTSTNPASTGTLNISGTSLVVVDTDSISAGRLIIGNRDATATVGQGSGTINQSGGILRIGAISGLYLSAYGDGTYNLTGGTLQIGGSNLHARNAGSGSYAFNLGGGTVQAYGSALTAAVNATLLSGTTSTIDTNSLGVAWSGVLSGSGALSKIGDGTLTLSGNNTFSGGTTLNGGTLRLGHGNALGTGGLTVQNGGVDFASAVTIANNITMKASTTFNVDSGSATQNGIVGEDSGSFGLTKTGGGTLTLGGVNNYTGATTISAGTLSTTAANAFSSLTAMSIASGAIWNAGSNNQSIGSLAGAGIVQTGAMALTIGGNNTSTTFSGVIGGNASLMKSGTGTLTLSGANTYAGGTTISGGTLLAGAVNVLPTATSLTIGTGGAFDLGGFNQTTGALTNAGKVSVGAGTSYSVIGNVTFNAGSTFEVGTNATQAGKIVATGNASLDGTVTVRAGTISNNTATILQAATISGTFAGVNSTYAFLNAALNYSATDVTLTLTPNGHAWSSVAATSNQSAVAASVEGLSRANPLYQSLLYLDAAEARKAFDLLSGEVFATLQGTLIGGTQTINASIFNRLAQGSGASARFSGPTAMQVSGGASSAYADDGKTRRPFAGRWPFTRAEDNSRKVSLWSQAFGNWTRTYGNADMAESRSNTGGVVTGYDVTVDRIWRYGLAAGFDRTWISSDARLSNATSDGYHVAAYGGVQQDSYALRGGAAFTWNDIRSNRTVAFTGFNEKLEAQYQSMSTQLFGEISTRLPAGAAIVEPYAGLSNVNTVTPGYSETGGSAALTAARTVHNTGFSTLGARAAGALPFGPQAVTLHGALGWRHAFGQRATTTQLALGGASAFNVNGAPIVGDTLLYDAGLTWAIRNGMSFDLSYAGELSTAAISNTVRGTFTYRY
ncbi:autotransporter outer membrane beta-barrel domain-containing protein [Undibacter mobilis]|uniref:autotransporter outer membrane beta-barrel domain-containing protein n=1 Tax=Undibacter mobilis TaxID=2292256 RepID=UPI00143DD187|nr:autotransporter domain-containing protein [Undibacter mobilis]